MTTLYDRNYELIIFTNPESSWSEGKTAQREVGAKSTVVDASQVTSLKMVFKVTKTNQSSTPTIGHISLYNCSDDTKAAIRQPNAMAILKAGYKTQADMPIIVSGKIRSSMEKKEGQDVVVSFEVGDGYVPYVKDIISLSWPAGTEKKTIFKDLAAKFKGLSLGDVRGLEEDFLHSTTTEQVAVSGRLSVVLDELADAEGFRWYIEDGKIYIQPKYYIPVVASPDSEPPKGDNVVRAFLIKDSNIKGSARPLTDETPNSELSSKKNTRKGVALSTFLDGRIKLDTYIKLDSEDLLGTYRVEKVTHEGDNRGGKWDTTVEAIVV